MSAALAATTAKAGTRPAFRQASWRPGAWSLAGDKKLFLFDCIKHRIGRYGDSKGKPGEITQISDTSVFIAAHSGQVEVLKVRTEDGKKMAAGDYARSQGLAAGSRLS